MAKSIQLSHYTKIDDEIKIEPKSTKDGYGNRVKAALSKFKKTKSYCSPALLNEIVLDCVFDVLSVQDLKNCRLVCRKWDEVVEPVVRKRSLIVLTPDGNKTYDEFKRVFNNSGSALPFEHLKIQDSSDRKYPVIWTFPQVEEVLHQWGTPLQHLELDINFQQILSPNPTLRPLTQTSLTTLVLNCSWNKTNNIKIPLSHLKKIKILRLIENTVLDIGLEEFKISPTEIELQGVKYNSNDQTVQEVLLNNFIDFRKAKKIKISHPRHEIVQKVFVRMHQSVNLDSLHLNGVELHKAWDAKWNVKGSVFLSNTAWIQSNQMKFTTLDFKNGSLDISQLPSKIERLALGQAQSTLFDDPMVMWEELSVFSMEPTVLHNLKYLSLDEGVYGPDDSSLHLFENCRQLTTVSLKNMSGVCWQMPRINIEALPQSVKILEIESLDSVAGDGFHSLEILILKNCGINPDILAEIMRTFAPRKIVVDTRSWGLVSQGFFKKCMKTLGVFQRSNEVDFWMGPVKFSSSSFKCYFKDHIAERCGSKHPKLISEEEFEEVRQMQIFKPDTPVFN